MIYLPESLIFMVNVALEVQVDYFFYDLSVKTILF